MEWNQLLIFLALAGIYWLLKHLGLAHDDGGGGSNFSITINPGSNVVGSGSDWDD